MMIRNRIKNNGDRTNRSKLVKRTATTLSSGFFLFAIMIFGIFSSSLMAVTDAYGQMASREDEEEEVEDEEVEDEEVEDSSGSPNDSDEGGSGTDSTMEYASVEDVGENEEYVANDESTSNEKSNLNLNQNSPILDTGAVNLGDDASSTGSSSLMQSQDLAFTGEPLQDKNYKPDGSSGPLIPLRCIITNEYDTCKSSHENGETQPLTSTIPDQNKEGIGKRSLAATNDDLYCLEADDVAGCPNDPYKSPERKAMSCVLTPTAPGCPNGPQKKFNPLDGRPPAPNMKGQGPNEMKLKESDNKPSIGKTLDCKALNKWNPKTGKWDCIATKKAGDKPCISSPDKPCGVVKAKFIGLPDADNAIQGPHPGIQQWGPDGKPDPTPDGKPDPTPDTTTDPKGSGNKYHTSAKNDHKTIAENRYITVNNNSPSNALPPTLNSMTTPTTPTDELTSMPTPQTERCPTINTNTKVIKYDNLSLSSHDLMSIANVAPFHIICGQVWLVSSITTDISDITLIALQNDMQQQQQQQELTTAPHAVILNFTKMMDKSTGKIIYRGDLKPVLVGFNPFTGKTDTISQITNLFLASNDDSYNSYDITFSKAIAKITFQ